MNTERMLSAGIAVVVVVAVGLSASTLASSMGTDPADAIDVDYDTLPLGEDAEGTVSAAAKGIHDQYSRAGDGQPDGAAGGAGDESRSAGDSGDSGQAPEQSAGGGASDASAADSAGSGQSSASSGSAPAVPVGWPRWLLLVVAAIVAVAYRYRDRLRRAVERGDERPAETWRPAPENEVERAWVELVRRTGVPQPRTRTPRECARLAVETGYDSAAVSRLRRAFEDVRYGTAPPTEEHERVARETLARLDGETQ